MTGRTAAPRYRAGVQDPRERYADRAMLLVELDTFARERWFVLEFSATGAPVGRDEFAQLGDAEHGFDELVAAIEREDRIRVRPL